MNLKRYIVSAILRYLYCQYEYLDQVEDSKGNFLSSKFAVRVEPQSDEAHTGIGTPKWFNRPFVWHLFVYAFAMVYGIFGLQYHHTGRIDLHALSTSPYIMSHQMFLPDLWQHGGDYCYFVAILTSFCAYANFVLFPVQLDRYKITVKNNGRLTSRQIGMQCRHAHLTRVHGKMMELSASPSRAFLKLPTPVGLE